LQRLLPYPAVLYDANIIVYYCFYCPVRLGERAEYLIQGELTEKVRTISDRLRRDGKTIKTIEVIMKEVTDVVLADAVRQRICNEEVREGVGLARGAQFPPMLELQILEKCRKSARKIQSAGWFVVDHYLAGPAEITALRQFFRNASVDPALRSRFSRHKRPVPSDQDLHLMSYSQVSRLPVLTDDGHFIVMRSELKTLGFATEIVPLRTVV